jgi:hypothetical protein
VRSPALPAELVPRRADERHREPGTAPASAAWPRPRRRAWVFVGAIAVYVALALVSNLPVWLHGFTHEIQNQGGDLPEAAWFLAVTPWSLVHGHNPFVTAYLNAPFGANLMANTTMFLPGVVLSPVTFLWGPVATFNVLMVLSIAGSATAAFAAIGRWVRWWPAAFAGGLLYGFSPYMVGAGYGHPNVLLTVFPPLLLVVLDDVLVRQGAHPWRRGALLGALAAGQFLTSTDILASAAVMAAIGTAVAVVLAPRRVPARLPYALKALAGALGVFAVVCSYPLWVLLAGPQHLHGTTQAPASLALYSSDLLSPVLPTVSQLLSPAASQHVADAFVRGDLSENGAYLGIPLLIVLVAMGVRLRRRPVARFAAAMVLVALVLSFGARLRIDGHTTGVRLPFVVFTHLPLLDNLLAVRFSLYVFLFAALLLALGLEDLHHRLAARTRRRWAGTSAAALTAAFALFPLLPRWPYQMTSLPMPAFFTTAAARSVPAGSVMLPYPFPSLQDVAMVWQAEDGFRYRLPGGYVLLPGPGDTAVAGRPSLTQGLLDAAYTGQPLPALSDAVVCGVADDLRVYRAATVVVTRLGAAPDEALELFDAVLGTRPVEVADVYVYDGVGGEIRATLAAHHCPTRAGLP